MFAFFVDNLLWSQIPLITIGLFCFTIIGYVFFRPLFYLSLFSLVFCFYFFRNPVRFNVQAAKDTSLIVSPADGTVIDLAYDPEGKFNGYEQKIAIFLSPLDVHVNWIPMSGVISKSEYKPGNFTLAFLPKSSELNERHDITIDNANHSLMVRQIAGTIARRICCWMPQRSQVMVGDKYGMIKFGSRVELFLPAHARIMVGIGQRVYGGQTIIGQWK